MADVMKFRLTVEVMVATHESGRAVRRRLKELVREALPMGGDHRAALHPIDAVMDLAVRIKTEDAFGHDHVESGCSNYGVLGWSCGRLDARPDPARFFVAEHHGEVDVVDSGPGVVVARFDNLADATARAASLKTPVPDEYRPDFDTRDREGEGDDGEGHGRTCTCAECLQAYAYSHGLEDAARDPLAEDYPGQRITGPDIMDAATALAAIVALLDGKAWDGDTLDQIADTCRAVGYTIGEVGQ